MKKKFQRFPKILQILPESHTDVSEDFPKISEDSPNVAQRSLGRFLPKILKVSEDFRGLPKTS